MKRAHSRIFPIAAICFAVSVPALYGALHTTRSSATRNRAAGLAKRAGAGVPQPVDGEPGATIAPDHARDAPPAAKSPAISDDLIREVADQLAPTIKDDPQALLAVSRPAEKPASPAPQVPASEMVKESDLIGNPSNVIRLFNLRVETRPE